MTSQHVPTGADEGAIADAIRQGGLIDLTTRGRRTGRQHRIEIAFFNFDGQICISGMPGPRDWYANLLADPTMTLHLKRGVTADLPGRARPITDPAERHQILSRITRIWRREQELDRFVADSPLVEITLTDGSADSAQGPVPR
jgi:deazaflavin-dependent oxidoreductase (nitroreductase family)